MKISIASEGFVRSEVLDNHVRSLIAEYLDTQHITIDAIHVTLHDHRDADGKRQRHAELAMVMPGLPSIDSEADSDDLYVAIRRCVQRAYRHLERLQRRQTRAAIS